MRFYRNVFRLSYACHAFLSECLACGSIQMSCVRSAPVMRSSRNVLRSVHACCLPPVRQTGRLAGCFVPVPPWVVIAIRAFSDVVRLSDLAGSLRACTFLYGDPDGERKGRGERSRRRGGRALLRDHIGFAVFSAGSTLGLRAPDCAKESSTLWTLFTLRRGYVGAYSLRRRPGKRVDPPGSNLWPGGSCCIAMLSTRSIVQTRAAPKRRGVGLRARSGVEAALRPYSSSSSSRLVFSMIFFASASGTCS